MTFFCRAAQLDKLGMVIDFKVMKSTLCEFLEREWDHKMLIWEKDPWADALCAVDPEGVLLVPFNPTAEQLANHLLRVVGPKVLPPEITLVRVQMDETRKCSAIAEL